MTSPPVSWCEPVVTFLMSEGTWNIDKDKSTEYLQCSYMKDYPGRNSDYVPFYSKMTASASEVLKEAQYCITNLVPIVNYIGVDVNLTIDYVFHEVPYYYEFTIPMLQDLNCGSKFKL